MRAGYGYQSASEGRRLNQESTNEMLGIAGYVGGSMIGGPMGGMMGSYLSKSLSRKAAPGSGGGDDPVFQY